MQTLGDRIKSYEACFDTILPKGLPQILRLDGRAFHTLTRDLEVKKPFDVTFHGAMCEAALAVCQDVTNARFAYVQSDEINILIYPEHTAAEPYFGNRLNKILSTTASLATLAFYKAMIGGSNGLYAEKMAVMPLSFDARIFIMPTHDVNNLFVWRYRDAIKNSVSALAQCHFNEKELHQINTEGRLKMLQAKGINWAELKSWEKYGAAIFHRKYEETGYFGRPGQETLQTVERKEWTIRDVKNFSEFPEQIEDLVMAIGIEK